MTSAAVLWRGLVGGVALWMLGAGASSQAGNILVPGGAEQALPLSGCGETQTVSLPCPSQKLRGTLSEAGLWVGDLVKGGSGEAGFHLSARQMGRSLGTMEKLEERGRVEWEGSIARWWRTGLVEEFSTSVNGIRQDFLVEQSPAGDGPFVLDLEVRGATVESAESGLRFRVADTGRMLAYGRLKVLDAGGRELPARMLTLEGVGLRIEVNDQGARYPIRVDPVVSDADWTPLSGLPGTNGPVYAAVSDGQGGFYVAGAFTVAGETLAAGVAHWNGSQWQGLGEGIQGSGHALALDGEGGLYVGGQFEVAGGQPAANLAHWDGEAWAPVGAGTNGAVYALLMRAPGQLVVGGEFAEAGGVEAERIAQWNGTQWQQLGGGVSDTVYALTANGNGGFFVGGSFLQAGAVLVNRLAEWTGTQWQALGQGLSDTVFALYRRSNGELVAGGDFLQSGSLSCAHLARWNGVEWLGYAGGPNNAVLAIAGLGDDLYVIGSLTQVGGGSARQLAKFSGAVWSGVGGGVNATGQALVVDSGGRVFAGGFFSEAGGVGARSVALFEAGAWKALGGGLSGQVSAAWADAEGNLYVGGGFTHVGALQVNRVAKWDGSAWSALGEGVNGVVLALTGHSDGTVYAAGSFTTAGGAPAAGVARWHNGSWSPLATGLAGGVRALALDGTTLYAGGDFTSTGAGVTVNHVARWNGTSWAAMGPGMDAQVQALAVGGSGEVFAGGSFTSAGGVPANAVASWNGTAWSAMGAGCAGTVSALSVAGSGRLYVGGAFTSAGGSPAANLAQWYLGVWSALGQGIGGPVRALAVDRRDTLFAGGTFAQAGGLSARNMALWNGTTWAAVGSGTDLTVRTLTSDGDRFLYAGGDFAVAGGKASGFTAQLTATPSAGPDLVVEQPVETRLTSGTAEANLGVVPIGSSSSLAFTVRNLGEQSLEGIVVSFAPENQPEDFAVTEPSLPSTLEAGASASFSVAFSPSEEGLRNAVLRIASNDPDPNPFVVLLKGTGAAPTMPFHAQQPQSQLVPLRQPVTFSATVQGEPPITHQWLRGTARIAGATSPALTLPSVKSSDARVYRLRSTNGSGVTDSAAAYLGVVTPLPGTTEVKVGNSLVLTAQVQAPAGTSLSYRWFRDGTALEDTALQTGTAGKTLRVAGILPDQAGTYHCQVTLTTPGGPVQGSSGECQVEVVEVPELDVITLPDTRVNQPVDLLLPLLKGPARFTALGLPPGVRLDAQTGALSGSPLVARLVKGVAVPYRITFQASNLAGASAPQVVNWTILPLPTGVVGIFSGLVDRNAVLNAPPNAQEGLGGSIRLVTSAVGAVSGSVRLGTATLRMKGRLVSPVDGGDVFEAILTVPRKRPLAPLSVQLTLDAATGSLTGEVGDGAVLAGLEAWRADPAGAGLGTYHAALALDAALQGQADYPQGTGFAVLKVAAKGVANWTGRLADGTVLTGSATTGVGGQVPLFLPAYIGTGSLQGWVEVDGDQVDGSLTWFKAPQATASTTRSYKAGIPLHTLSVVGDLFLPASVSHLAITLANAQLRFALGGLTTPLLGDYAISSALVATPLNPGADTLTLKTNPKTGLITAGLALAAEPGRKGSGFGLLVPRLNQGVGFFSLPESPAKTAPIISGQLELNAR